MLFSCFRDVFFLPPRCSEMLVFQWIQGYHRDTKWYMFVPLNKENMGPEKLHVPFLYKGIKKEREPVSRFPLEKCLIVAVNPVLN